MQTQNPYTLENAVDAITEGLYEIQEKLNPRCEFTLWTTPMALTSIYHQLEQLTTHVSRIADSLESKK